MAWASKREWPCTDWTGWMKYRHRRRRRSAEFDGDTFKTYVIEPEQFGLQRGAKSDIVGGTPAENAAITRSVLSGEKRHAADGRRPQCRSRLVRCRKGIDL